MKLLLVFFSLYIILTSPFVAAGVWITIELIISYYEYLTIDFPEEDKKTKKHFGDK